MANLKTGPSPGDVVDIGLPDLCCVWFHQNNRSGSSTQVEPAAACPRLQRQQAQATEQDAWERVVLRDPVAGPVRGSSEARDARLEEQLLSASLAEGSAFNPLVDAGAPAGEPKRSQRQAARRQFAMTFRQRQR